MSNYCKKRIYWGDKYSVILRDIPKDRQDQIAIAIKMAGYMTVLNMNIYSKDEVAAVYIWHPGL